MTQECPNIFGLLEPLSAALIDRGGPDIRGGFARGTGGVDIPYLIEVLTQNTTREQRLDYERRILAAEVETVRLAQRSKRFAEMIQRNTSTLDAALTVANFDADKRGYDRLAVEPWMPALLSVLDDIAQILPEDDNQNGLLSEKQPKSVVAAAGVGGKMSGEFAPFRDWFFHKLDRMQRTTLISICLPMDLKVAQSLPTEMQFTACDVIFSRLAASADTLPEGQDAQQGLAGTESGAVPEGQTPNPSPSPAAGR